MPQESTTLTTFYKGWQAYQDKLIQAIAPLTPDRLALQVAPHLRSLGVIAAHIISARAYWFHDMIGEGGADIAALVDIDDEVPFRRTAAELVAGLQTTGQLMQDALARWTPAELAAESVPGRRRSGQTVMLSRQWIVWHLLEHDLHHGGELSLTLGMHGLEAPKL